MNPAGKSDRFQCEGHSNSPLDGPKKFGSEALALSQRMLEQSYEKGAKFYSQTLTIAVDDFAYYEDCLRTLMSEMTARSDGSKAEEIVQLNMQLFRINPDSLKEMR